MDYQGLGRRIRKQRKLMHLTQEALAEKAGISLSFLGHIERGTRKASIETLVNIANALVIPLDDMLQDSLSREVLQISPMDVEQCNVLREIDRILNNTRSNWENG